MTSIRSFLLNVEVLVLNSSAKHHGSVSVNCLGISGETTLLAHLALFIGRFPTSKLKEVCVHGLSHPDRRQHGKYSCFLGPAGDVATEDVAQELL